MDAGRRAIRIALREFSSVHHAQQDKCAWGTRGCDTMRGATLQSDEVVVLKAPWMVPDRPTSVVPAWDTRDDRTVPRRSCSG
jgi:hypothetical protein